MSELLTPNDRVFLADVCKDWFGLSERIAIRKATNGLLPIPAFRISGTRRGPFYVRRTDFDRHIERQIKAAEELNSKMREAGKV